MNSLELPSSAKKLCMTRDVMWFVCIAAQKGESHFLPGQKICCLPC